MSTETLVTSIVAAVLALYPKETRAIIDGQWSSFWKARKQDFELLKMRHLAGSGKHDLPDPLTRQTIKTLVVLGACMGLLYAFQRFGDSQDLVMKFLSRTVGIIALAAIIRHMIIINLFTGYRAKLLWESLSGGRSGRTPAI